MRSFHGDYHFQLQSGPATAVLTTDPRLLLLPWSLPRSRWNPIPSTKTFPENALWVPNVQVRLQPVPDLLHQIYACAQRFSK